mmetsp:Transcript_79813/g.222195  ORF Transcript_79813/g.222195 Transcript_79813/m.222195 type:complete len:225 (-) Transcript_79813:613-1287(-)
MPIRRLYALRLVAPEIDGLHLLLLNRRDLVHVCEVHLDPRVHEGLARFLERLVHKVGILELHMCEVPTMMSIATADLGHGSAVLKKSWLSPARAASTRTSQPRSFCSPQVSAAVRAQRVVWQTGRRMKFLPPAGRLLRYRALFGCGFGHHRSSHHLCAWEDHSHHHRANGCGCGCEHHRNLAAGEQWICCNAQVIYCKAVPCGEAAGAFWQTTDFFSCVPNEVR